MSEATSQTLLRAYELIEADEQEQARELLEPVLATDPDNADAWWLYAHAVATPEKAHEALTNLMRIDPDYPGATDLRAKVQAELPEAEVEVATYESAADAAVDETFSRFVRWLALVGLIIGILLVAFLLLSGQGGDEDDVNNEATAEVASEPTLAIVVPSDQETAEVQASSTDTVQATSETNQTGESTESEVDADLAQRVVSAFDGFDLASEPTSLVNDQLSGDTLLVGVCGNDAPLALIDEAMAKIASISADITGVDAVGIRIYDCVSGDVINSLAVSLGAAQDFSNETIDLRSYQSQWRVLG